MIGVESASDPQPRRDYSAWGYVQVYLLQCYSSCCTLAVPPRPGQGSVWARGDPAVDLIVRSLPSWNDFTTKAVCELRNITNKFSFDASTTTAAKRVAEDDLSRAGARPPPFFDDDRRGGCSDQTARREVVVPTIRLHASASASAANAPRSAAGLPPEKMCLSTITPFK